MIIRKVALVSGVLAFVLTASDASSETIRMSGFTWPGAVLTQEIVTNIIESRLGHEVEIVSVDIAEGMAAMCKEDGSIDVQVDFGCPTIKKNGITISPMDPRSAFEPALTPISAFRGYLYLAMSKTNTASRA